MTDDEAMTQQADSAQPPTEGGSGTAVTDEGSETAAERQDEAEAGASQEGRGREQ